MTTRGVVKYSSFIFKDRRNVLKERETGTMIFLLLSCLGLV